MAEITVTTTQTVIEVTQTGEITVTAPTEEIVITEVGVTNTDQLIEGSTNLFYTDARWDARLATKTTTNLAEGTNLYYTDARADARVALGIAGIDYPVDSVNGQTNTVVLDTDDITEGGTNLYYTDARADARVALGIAGIDFPVDSVNGQTNTVVLDTDDIAEGGTNLYYTTARANSDFDTRLATKTTDNLNEGATNKYFTNALARQAIQVSDTGGDGSLSYDNSSGVITYTGPTAAEVRAHFSGGTGVTITDGVVAIGQPVATTSNVTFNDGVFNGNLTVNGTTTYVNTTDLNITDKTITIAYGQTGIPTQNAGIIVDRGDLTDSELRWNEATDKWEQVRAGTATVLPINTTELAEGDNKYYLDSRARLAISVTDTGGDGSLSYDNSTGVITYTGPSASEVRAHFSGGTGVTITDGVVAIGQPVATTDDVQFDIVDATQFESVKSVATSGAPLLANGEILTYGTLNATGAASGAVPTLGVLVENYTAGNGGALVVVDHGQNRSGGTSTTAGSPILGLESTRGTALAPTATGNNDTIGVINMSGYDGVRGLSTDVAAASAQLVGLAAGAYTNDGTYTTNAGANLIVRTQPQNLRATASSRQNILFNTWALVAGAPPTQNILWNSTSMTTQYDGATGTSYLGHGKQSHTFFHPEFNIQGVPSQDTAPDNNNISGTNRLNFFSHRQSGWSGRRDAVQNNDTLAEVRVFGQTGTNSTGSGSQTGTLAWTAAENFTGSVRGSRFAVQTGEIGTNTLSDRITIDSQSGTISTTRVRQVTPGNANYGGEISMKAGILNGATGYDKTTELSVTALTLDGSNAANYETKTNRFNGTNYSPTQTNDILGRFTFLGNYGSSTTPLSVNAAGSMQVRAAENFTDTATGTRISLSVNKLGTNSGLDAIEASSAQATLRADTIVFQDSSLAALKGGKIDYRRTFGCFHKIADVTAVAANTVYEFDWYNNATPHVGNSGVTVNSGNPTRINIDTAASYDVFMEMQAKNTDNAERTAWIWLAKGGVDLDETRIKVTLRPATSADTHQLISKAWCVTGIAANEYLEVRFAVDNISGISLEYEAAQVSPFAMPAMPSATITVSPIGA